MALCDSSDTAWDLLQSAMTKVLSSGHQPVSVALLRTSIKHLYIDRYRREQRFEHVELSEWDSQREVIPMDEPSFDDLLASQQEFDVCWQSMSSAERELMYFHVIEGYSIREIAELTETSRGTILSKVFRLKRRLRALLESRNLADGSDRSAAVAGDNE